MTARGLRVLTLAFPDPDSQPIRSDDFLPVNASESYNYAERGLIRTLSQNGARPGRNIDGLLFTPTLPTGACPEAAQWASPNATSTDDLPHENNIYWIATAPWINAPCTLAFLQAVQNTQTQAYLFYLTDNSTDIPPSANSPAWSLGEGGAWKAANNFPVYAISSMFGQELMRRLAEYSGNVTQVPNGAALLETWPATDYVRLAAEISMEGGNRLPSLWIFLLIVLGILVLIIGVTSCSMHYIQRRRRVSLQARVANGQVDLEALGIKRLTVPQEMIDKLPLYTYSDDPKEVENGHTPDPTSSVNATHPHPQFSQSTCPICLEDYTSAETTVRELPCRHIFHPECVDAFLVRNSSLCPMCKKSVLPRGHCPALVTNAMVRRERLVRLRRQGRIDAAANAVESGTPGGSVGYSSHTPAQRTAAFTRRMFSGSRGQQTSSQAATQAQDMEMEMQSQSQSQVPATAPATTTTVDGQPCPESTPTPTPRPVPTDRQGRREWARQRAVSMVGQREQERAQDAEVAELAAQRPVWRRAVGRVFPGFA